MREPRRPRSLDGLRCLGGIGILEGHVGLEGLGS
jgi:hypothetical protein